MKIFFDYKIFYQQRFGGISNYFFNLGQELIKLNQDVLFLSPLHKNNYLNKIPKKHKYAVNLKKFPFRINPLIEKINHYFSDKLIKKKNPDILHETYYSRKNFNTKKIVCTVYDMINEKYPNFFLNFREITEIKKLSIMRADHIICISNTTKADLINYFNIDEKKITVTSLASDFDDNIKNNSDKYFMDSLLFVGSRRGYKNFEGFLKAYSISDFLRNNYKIIAYGGEKFSNIDYEIIKKYQIKKNQISFLNDKTYELSYLYSNVAAFIYPSFYEGFGIPLLEAMKSGCPIISSNAASLKEVGGEGIIYFDPSNAENISFQIEKVLSSEELKKEIISYGFRRSRDFSWKKCATETLQVYKKIL